MIKFADDKELETMTEVCNEAIPIAEQLLEKIRILCALGNQFCEMYDSDDEIYEGKEKETLWSLIQEIYDKAEEW